jgi:hypothetical protein
LLKRSFNKPNSPDKEIEVWTIKMHKVKSVR